MGTFLRNLVLACAVAAAAGSAVKQQQQPAPGPAGAPAGATCESACWHYLDCKGLAGNPAAEGECVSECNARGVSQAELDQFVMLDCPTAIEVAEGGGQGGDPGTGGDPGAG